MAISEGCCLLGLLIRVIKDYLSMQGRERLAEMPGINFNLVSSSPVSERDNFLANLPLIEGMDLSRGTESAANGVLE